LATATPRSSSNLPTHVSDAIAASVPPINILCVAAFVFSFFPLLSPRFSCSPPMNFLILPQAYLVSHLPRLLHSFSYYRCLYYHYRRTDTAGASAVAV
jgi:hypothetical protein